MKNFILPQLYYYTLYRPETSRRDFSISRPWFHLDLISLSFGYNARTVEPFITNQYISFDDKTSKQIIVIIFPRRELNTRGRLGTKKNVGENALPVPLETKKGRMRMRVVRLGEVKHIIYIYMCVSMCVYAHHHGR